MFLRDHAEVTRAQLDGWLKQAAAAGARVAVTGKDFVKWRALGIPLQQVLVFEPKLEFESGLAHWERVLWG